MKHTPGPWKVRYMRDGEPEAGFFIEAANNNRPELGYGIEIMMEDFGEHNGYPMGQRLADANLIAAAPDLVKALEQVLNMDESQGHEGCTYGDTKYDSLSAHHGSNEMLNHIKSILEPAIAKARGL